MTKVKIRTIASPQCISWSIEKTSPPTIVIAINRLVVLYHRAIVSKI